ncbi:GntR family transcriptional regulator [Desulfosporosinus sp. PR]|uniref:GntR family transcriptional regulator n=1 Tax=Candidatus Desulfosporosinus nitrosoreducens TaxID=3401928 RepID=UPI0027F55C08|nr:GntR family transcriptional regulator [Desulfosporosinus sp. PR]MDQ7095270.1 GntR family transcriptional regulator [Desulfosporosinus sp. PR]
MALDAESSIPLHIQLSELLKGEILQGTIKEKIPPERVLMELYSVSRSTVRRAIAALISEGILESRRGSGTYIYNRPLEEWLGNLVTYNKTIDDLGMKPGAKLLSQGVVASTQELKDITQMDELYLINRLRLADNIPIAIETQYYPVNIGKQLSKFNLDEIVLYEVLESSLGIKLWEADQVISSTMPTKEEAQLLDILECESVLVIERSTCDYDGNLVEYLRGIFRSDMYAFRIKLGRNKL